ncbi:MAG: ABC transporter substrate-binding protein [bacterium]|nr:ABC transporter substrate-binding protein [bacterium]
MKSNIILLLLCLLSLGCGNSGEGGDPAVFHNYLSEEPQSLDPAFAVDQSSGILVSLLYPGLFRFAADGTPVPDLVDDWQLSADGLIYTFRLHPDRSFDDGSVIDTDDVIRCFLRLLDPEHPSPRRWVLDGLKGAQSFIAGHSGHVAGLNAPDAHTLVVELETPFSPFLGLLAMPATRLYPAASDGTPAQIAGLPVCGGPWRLTEWHRGDRFLLGRREMGGPDNFTGLEFRIIPQPFTAGAEFSVGNLDLLQVPLTEVAYWVEGEHKGTVTRQEELVISYIGLNTERAPFNDPRVRQALNYAIDVEALIRTCRSGAATRAGGPVPPSLREGAPREQFRYRPERARELLAEAGLSAGFDMEIWQKENPEVSRILETVQIFLADVGIEVKIVVRDWGAFKDAINKGSADAFFLDWLADYPDAENFLYPLFHTSNRGGGGNRCRYSEPVTDILLDELRATPESDARRRLVAQLNDSIYTAAPWIWLWYPVSIQVLNPRIHSYQPPVIFNGQDYLEVTRDVALPTS